jgi:flagella basal body P-ring formation protein FlgA
MITNLRFFLIIPLLVALIVWSDGCFAITNRKAIYTFIENALKNELSDESIIINFKIENCPEILKLSDLQEQIDRVELLDFSLNNSTVKSRFYLNDGSDISLNVIDINLSKNFASTAKSIAAGKVIDSDDIGIVNVGLEKFKPNNYITKEEVIGMQAARRLPPGVLIKKQNLNYPLVIKSGNIVNVIYQGGNIKLQSIAKAMQNGLIGDTIKLKTMDNKNMLLGVILDKDTVVINAKN